ncbi:MAG: HDOD domain-containing protein [Deltaproteobacteria bacterium]|nr:HDOD domain-containing protein [Deltaproteobacteria bacterium]
MTFPARKSGQNLRLPSPPMVLSRLLTMLAEDRSSADELADVILEDPGLTARILRVANSPFYNFSNKIETVSHAIALLGCRSIRILCASESFLAIFPQRKGNFTSIFQDYCRHSLATALLAKIMAEEMAVPLDSEKIFIAGLLHDIGKPVLWYNFLEQAEFYHDLTGRGMNEREAERLAYGVDHSEAGAWVAGEWGLDSELAKTMAHHHENCYCGETVPKEISDYSLLEIVVLANTFAKCLELKDGKIVFAPVVERYVSQRLPGLDWTGVALLFAEQAPLYEIEQLAELNGRKASARTRAETAATVAGDENDPAYEELLQRSLTLFKAYNSFLENFRLTDIFAGILENLSSLTGVEAVSIMLYKSREQSLTVQTAAGADHEVKLGKRLLLSGEELTRLRELDNLAISFNGYSRKEGKVLETRLATMFLPAASDNHGLFLPVYGERNLVGAFCLELAGEKLEEDAVFRELLLGHAVQLALAIRFYHLTRKLRLLKEADASTTSSLVLGHALKDPLRVLRENIYLLDQEGKNASLNRSGYRHIYCQKIKQALEDVNALVARYATSPHEERNYSESLAS